MSEIHHKSGIRDGNLFLFDDHEHLHGIFVAICAPIIMFIVFCHLYHFYKQYKLQSIKTTLEHSSKDHSNQIEMSGSKSNKKSKHKRNASVFPKKKASKTLYYYSWITHVIIISSLMVAIFDIIVSLLVYFHININDILVNKCRLFITMIAYSWGYTKFQLYYMALLRLIISFKDSMYEYPKWFIRVIFVYITVSTLSGFAFMAIWSKGISIYNDDKEYYWCQYRMNGLFLLVTLCFDTITNTLLCVLFIIPLLKLNNILLETDKIIIGVIARYGYLTIIGIASTAIYSVFLLFGLGSLQILDQTVNLSCMVLMSPVNKEFYMKYCIYPHKMCENICLIILRKCFKKDTKTDGNKQHKTVDI